MTITQDPNVYWGMFIDPEFEQYVEVAHTTAKEVRGVAGESDPCRGDESS